MSNALAVVYSLPFVAGAVAGAGLMKLYQWHHCRHLDKLHPLPGGRKRRVPGISQQWWGGLVAIAVLGYVLLQVNQTEASYKKLAARIEACQTGLASAINVRADISTQNDALSVQQRDLLTELDDASGTWINRLINPPPDIAALDLNDPRRQAWGFDVTRVYYERATKLRQRISEIREEQSQLAEERNRRPMPAPSCN